MRDMSRRLDALEKRFPEGCDVCRGWLPTVLCDDTGDCLRPEVCPQCGRRVPIEMTVTLSGVRLAAV